MNISQDQAKSLLFNGAILITAGVPVGTEFGIDLSTNTVDEMFRGVKMIPPGPHYVYTAAQGLYGDSAERVGFMHYFKSQEIIVREWDNVNEQLRLRQIANAAEEIVKIKEHLFDLDRFLAPYDYTQYDKWNFLTRYIDEQTVNDCMPECGIVKTSAEFESCSDAERPRGNKITAIKHNQQYNSHQTENYLLPNLKLVQKTVLRMKKLPQKCPINATPQQITASHMDSFDAVDGLIKSYTTNPERLISEIQFAFILYFAGHSIDGLDHWRQILNLMANSERSVEIYPRIYAMYLDILQYQLPELPVELMAPTLHNTIYKDVQCLIVNGTEGGVKKCADHLAYCLTQSMEWSFEGIFDDDPEDMPVIVEI